ncbi:MAG: leucine-rich repeat protein [Bacilli bacterium]|nr:leucine-rich repeat protein [Bacilli bacterium]
MNKKKLTPLIIAGGGILISLFVIMSSYAYWQLTRKQKNPNEMVSACLNLELANADEENTGITLGDAWPISDEEGRNLEGYTFTVENKCPFDVNYVIGLESLEVEGATYLDNQYVKLVIDDEQISNYEGLTTIDNIILENDTETIRETKEVTTATVTANKMNTHKIRLWLAEEAPLNQQNRTFKSRVMITGGQGIQNPKPQPTEASCFTLDEEGKGEIIGYNASCGTNVVIPARINGDEVKTIDSNAFKVESAVYNYSFVNVFDSSWNIQNTLVIDPTEEANIRQWANENGYSDIAIDVYNNNIVIDDNHQFQYCNLVDNQPVCDIASSFDESALITSQAKISISELDLSQTIYLETIETSAFSNVPANVTDLTEYENYETGLTQLNFGNNNKEIIFGHNSFANTELDNLTLYSTYITKYNSTDFGDDDINWDKPFGNSTIKQLNIIPTVEDTAIGYETLELTETNYLVTDSVFQGINVETLNIHEGITAIFQKDGVTPFGNSTLGTVNVPGSVDLNYTGLNSANSIETLNLGNGITEIPRVTFYQANIKNINIPASVTIIKDRAFKEVKNLQKVVFEDTTTNPSQLQRIETEAFHGNSLIKDITIPSSIEFIGRYSFHSMTSGSTITINKAQDAITFEDPLNWSGNATVTYIP